MEASFMAIVSAAVLTGAGAIVQVFPPPLKRKASRLWDRSGSNRQVIGQAEANDGQVEP